jgi:threonine 3-dehydrogenase
MAKLVTGGTGYIGAETVRKLVNRGEEVIVFDIAISRYRIEDIEDKVKIVRGDLGNFSEVINLVKGNNIDTIYHMGSMLTYMAELDPWAAFRANILGTYHIFEAARLFNVPKVMFTSTLGTFGLGVQGTISDISLQRPTTFYGSGKLYCESLGRWYSKKFGLDFRSVRYAHMIGPNVRTPGHWAPPMIEDAIMGKSTHNCIYGGPETTVSMIYVDDAAKAAVDIMDAPREKVKMMNYNVADIPDVISAKEVEAYLKTHYPLFNVNYEKDPVTGITHHRPGLMTRFDDSYARKEWGWSPIYTNLETIVNQFQKDVKGHPKRYGLPS